MFALAFALLIVELIVLSAVEIRISIQRRKERMISRLGLNRLSSHFDAQLYYRRKVPEAHQVPHKSKKKKISKQNANPKNKKKECSGKME